jgi:hypothetical protein
MGRRISRKYQRKLKNRGMYIDKDGYKRNIDRNRLVNRVVADRKMNSKLLPWEEVHHKKRNKLDK